MAGGNQRLALGQQVYQYFLDKGLPAHQAAAIAGNMAWEGGGRTDLVNPGDNWKNSPRSPHSFGIAQWNDRLPALIDYARTQGKEIPAGDLRDQNYIRSIAPQLDLDTQLGFAWNEMQGSEGRAFKSLAAAPDLRSATAGAISYHRPAGWSWGNPYGGHGFEGRMTLAQQIQQSGGTPRAQQPFDMYGEDVRPAAPVATANAQPANSTPAPFGLFTPTAQPQAPASNGPIGLNGDTLTVGPFSIGGVADSNSGAEKEREREEAPPAPQPVDLRAKPIDMQRVYAVLNNRSRLGLS